MHTTIESKTICRLRHRGENLIVENRFIWLVLVLDKAKRSDLYYILYIYIQIFKYETRN